MRAGGSGAIGGLTRRQVLRAGAAAAVGGGLWLAGCAPSKGSAGPTANGPHIHIVLMPWSGVPGGNGHTGQQLLLEGAQHWSSQYRNVDVHIEPFTGTSGVVDAILTGQGPDVFEDWTLAPYFEGDLVLPLDEYMRRDQVDPSLWSPSLMSTFTRSEGLLALPAYTNVYGITANLSYFDSAGLERPDPNWTYQDLVQLAPKIMMKNNGSVRPGFVLGVWSNFIGNRTWIYQAFGGSVMDKTGVVSTLGLPNSLAAGRWVYDDLLVPGYALTQSAGPDLPNSVLFTMGTQAVLGDAMNYQNFQWDYYPMPYFPVKGATTPQSEWQRATYQTDDAYMISKSTKYPEYAWDLLRWICADTWWQQYMVKIFLLAPSRLSLLDYWVSQLQSRVPPLKDKSLHWFADAAKGGWGFPQQYYAYEDPQAEQAVTPFLSQVQNGTLSVEAAFPQIDHVIDALEQQGQVQAGLVAKERKAETAIAAVTPSATAHYPAPATAGLGHPSSDASAYVQSSNGTWTLLGDGADLSASEDDAIFACQAVTDTEGTWTCQVTALANVSESPQLSNNVKVGLLARGDLSDLAAEVGLVVTGAYGLYLFMRGSPTETSLVDHRFLWPKGADGTVQQFTTAPTTPVPNFISRPIWLRLQRQGITWTASASLDGKTFQTMAQPLTVPGLGGAWMGLVCCAHNSDFGNSGYIRASFDNLTGFTPDHSVQLGMTGVAPAAGAVPSDWATASVAATASQQSSSASS